MDWKDIAGAVGKAAPLLGTVLGGPAGAAVGAIVASALGTETSPEAIATVMQDPATLVRLREIETTHAARLQSIALETTRAELADLAGARSRDVELAKLGRHNTRADVMVLSAAGGLLACLLSLVLYREKIPPEAVGIISTVAGLFGACLKDAFAFEFGSTRSSQLKDATISNLTTR